jgi:endonuclease-3
MNPSKCRKIFERFAKNNHQPKTELQYSSTFELLVAVMLSAQMTDKGVNKATDKLFAIANTPQKILKLGEAKLLEYLKSINLYKTKTKNLLKTSELLIEKHNSEVPNTREALEELPGIGRKTANVILSIAFNHPTIAVDTHIFRVSNRTKLAVEKTPRKVEDKLVKIIPKNFLVNAHHWLILHGRYICIARAPKCSICIINDLCEYEDKNL